MVVTTWSGSKVEIDWWDVGRWARWLLGHARSLATRHGRALRRMTRADSDFFEHMDRCALCSPSALPQCPIALELDAEAYEARRSYKARYGVA